MALTSERPYRPALRSEEALAIIRADVPQRLDREAFTALEPVLAEQGGTPHRPGSASTLTAPRRRSTPRSASR